MKTEIPQKLMLKYKKGDTMGKKVGNFELVENVNINFWDISVFTPCLTNPIFVEMIPLSVDTKLNKGFDIISTSRPHIMQSPTPYDVSSIWTLVLSTDQYCTAFILLTI